MSNQDKRNYYDRLNDEELLQIRGRGKDFYDVETQKIVEEILLSRNIQPPPIPEKEIDIKSIKKPLPKSLFLSTIIYLVCFGIVKKTYTNYGKGYEDLILLTLTILYILFVVTIFIPRNPKTKIKNLKNQIGKNGFNEMMYCSIVGDVNRLKELIEYGGDIDVQDSDGVTALMYSLESNHVEVTKLLLDSNPDLSLKTNKGNSIIEISQKLNNESSKLVLSRLNK